MASFEEVYETLHGRVLRYLTRLVGKAEAEDVTQETFAKICQALEGFRGKSELHTWAYKIATNMALDRLRSRSFTETSHDPAVIESIASIEDVGVWTGRKPLTVEQQAIRKEMSSCVREVIDRLPDNYRTAIVLSDLEGFKDGEVAEVLGLTLSATKIRLHRARTRLRQDSPTAASSTETRRTSWRATGKVKLMRT